MKGETIDRGDRMLQWISLLSGFPLLLLRLSDGHGSFPKPLSAKEERHWLERSAEGDREARNILIERNLRLVAHIVRKYYSQTDEQDDLISIGTIGLIKGIGSFRPEKGVRLATYASRCIENEILMYFRSRRKTAGDVSLSDSVDTDREGNSLALLDVLSDEKDMFEELSDRELCGRLSQAAEAVLDTRERELLSLRYGLGGGEGMTQRETAARMGISRSYVSRIEKAALEKLRLWLER